MFIFSQCFGNKIEESVNVETLPQNESYVSLKEFNELKESLMSENNNLKDNIEELKNNITSQEERIKKLESYKRSSKRLSKKFQVIND